MNNLDAGRNGSMTLKVDITKAFHTVSCDFLIKVLCRMHFSDKFVQMVLGILHSTRLSILINGTLHGYFSYSRGVHQGDPLLSLLFCLAKEALVKWIDHCVDSSYLTVCHRMPSYPLYANDILIFLEDRELIAGASSDFLLNMDSSLARALTPQNPESYMEIRLRLASSVM